MEAFGKRVVARIKSEGLADIGEDSLKSLATALCEELKAEVLGNDKGWDDYLVAPIDTAKAMLLKALDKVDGKVG